MRQTGFTLIELVVTLVVIGILAVVAIPRISSTQSFDQAGFRDRLLTSMQYARKAAVAQRRFTCVVIAGGDAVFKIDTALPDGRTSDGATQCGATLLPMAAADKTCTGANAGSCVRAPTGLTLSPATLTIVFDPQGGYGGGSNAQLTLSSTDINATITVEAGTGYVH